jgi:hypothetical protein
MSQVIQSAIRIETVDDICEMQEARARRMAFDLNSEWLETHASQVYAHRGKHICIAGQELFVADTAEEALRLGQAAHPMDAGILLRFVPLQHIPRIYSFGRYAN